MVLCLVSDIFPVLILYSWWTLDSYLQYWMVDFYNESEGVVMSFISRSLLLLWNLSFIYADCAVCVISCKYRYGSRLGEIPVRCYMTSPHPHSHCRNQPCNTGDESLKFIKNIISTQGRYHLPSTTPLLSQCF